MKIDKELVAGKVTEYLRHELTRQELVNWAEDVLMDGEFDDSNLDELRSVDARLGVADVRAFGLDWEDCQELLHLLGYTAKIDIVASSG